MRTEGWQRVSDLASADSAAAHPAPPPERIPFRKNETPAGRGSVSRRHWRPLTPGTAAVIITPGVPQVTLRAAAGRASRSGQSILYNKAAAPAEAGRGPHGAHICEHDP